MRSWINYLAVLAIVGCSGGDDDGGPPDPPDIACSNDESALQVLVGNTQFEASASTDAVFVNAIDGDPGYLDATVGMYHVYMEWDSLLMNGGTKTARGFLEYDGGSGIAGNCMTSDNVSRIWEIDTGDEDVSENRFALEELHVGPDYCAGAPVTGSVVGCVNMAF